MTLKQLLITGNHLLIFIEKFVFLFEKINVLSHKQWQFNKKTKTTNKRVHHHAGYEKGGVPRHDNSKSELVRGVTSDQRQPKKDKETGAVSCQACSCGQRSSGCPISWQRKHSWTPLHARNVLVHRRLLYGAQMRKPGCFRELYFPFLNFSGRTQ